MKKMLSAFLFLALLTLAATAFAAESARYSLPDKDFPVPMLNGAPVPYKYTTEPEPGYEVTSYVYAVSGPDLMESYKKQLKKAGFADLGRQGAVESLWRYDRKSDGKTLMVEMFQENGELSIGMYVNELGN